MRIRRRTEHTLAVLLSGATAALLGACAPAATAPPEEPSPQQVRTGYGAMDREDVTTAISSLSAEELKHQRARDLGDLLMGRVPGLQVIRGPYGPSLRIRGVSSFMGNSEPLVVVDGTALTQSGLWSVLSGISPHDVERVDVLKDAAAAIYGSRGGNGVILITTKRPR